MNAAHRPRVPCRAGFGKLIRICGGPHGGLLLAGVNRFTVGVIQVGFHQPLPELLVGRKQRPSFIQRSAVCQPAFDGVVLSLRNSFKRNLRIAGEHAKTNRQFVVAHSAGVVVCDIDTPNINRC